MSRLLRAVLWGACNIALLGFGYRYVQRYAEQASGHEAMAGEMGWREENQKEWDRLSIALALVTTVHAASLAIPDAGSASWVVKAFWIGGFGLALSGVITISYLTVALQTVADEDLQKSLRDAASSSPEKATSRLPSSSATTSPRLAETLRQPRSPSATLRDGRDRTGQTSTDPTSRRQHHIEALPIELIATVGALPVVLLLWSTILLILGILVFVFTVDYSSPTEAIPMARFRVCASVPIFFGIGSALFAVVVVELGLWTSRRGRRRATFDSHGAS